MHGYITFGYDSLDYDYSESITEHFKIPRIALIYDQFDIDAGGSIYAETLGESDDDDYRLVITYWDVREVVDTYYGYGYETGASYTMQATLFLQTGVVKMSYSQIKPLDGYTYPSASDDDCVNSDNGATDSYYDDCDAYTLYPWWCGGYDDDDFTSNEMCCACSADSSADTEALMGDGAVGLSSGSFPFLDTTMVDFDDCSTASYYSYTYGDLADDSSYSSYCTSNTSYTAPVEIFEALYYDDGSGAEFDLDGLRILFTPDGDSAYSWETWAPDDGSGKRLFDVPSTSAILLDLMDDDYMSVAINDGFTFYGTTYLQVNHLKMTWRNGVGALPTPT